MTQENRVECYFCHKPIHVSRLAGFFNDGSGNNAFCNRMPCLVEFSNWKDRSSIQDTDDFKTHDLSVANENTEEL